MRTFPPSVTNLCLCLIKVIVLALLGVCFSITATYLSWRYFKYLCSLLVACILESTALRVGVKTLYHTIQTVIELSKSGSNHSVWHCVVLIKLLD